MGLLPDPKGAEVAAGRGAAAAADKLLAQARGCFKHFGVRDPREYGRG